MVTSSFFRVRFAISGKDEEWQEALSSSKNNVNVISVTSTKRKAKVSMSRHNRPRETAQAKLEPAFSGL